MGFVGFRIGFIGCLEFSSWARTLQHITANCSALGFLGGCIGFIGFVFLGFIGIVVLWALGLCLFVALFGGF